MNKPRASVFYDGLQVTAKHIRQLDDDQLNELMGDLLRAQADRCRSALNELDINSEKYASDDGCDAFSARPLIPDDWLGGEPTCWQFKAGTSGQPAKLKGEIAKRIPRKTLKEKGRYVVVASNCPSGKKGRGQRLKVLISEAKRLRLPRGKIFVFDAGQLTTWCNQHPAIAAKWAGYPSGIAGFKKWAANSLHRAPWYASEVIQAKLTAARESINFLNGEVRHIHIHGQAGVGKTRFALEMCREASWREAVVYVGQEDHVRLIELIETAAQFNGIRLVVVADEVQQQRLKHLSEAADRAEGRIRLITIGTCRSHDSTRIPEVEVPPLEDIMAKKVVSEWYPAMPPEHVAFVVRFAAGFMRLLRLAADKVFLKPALSTNDLLDHDDLAQFLRSLLGDCDYAPLFIIATLMTVGWERDVQIEGETIAKHLGFEWPMVRRQVHDLHQRFGIAPQGGRFRYISPLPLGNYLAREAWRIYRDRLEQLPDVLPNERARQAYYDRLGEFSPSLQTRQFAREKLQLYSRLSDFLEASAVRQWSSFTPADPALAATGIERALGASTIDERRLIANRTRRDIIATLVKLAWRTDCFFSAARSLAMLAEAENEKWTNNATGQFLELFNVYLAGTAVPYQRRLLVVDELLNSASLERQLLGIKALCQVKRTYFARFEIPPISGQIPEKEWHPNNSQEQNECVTTAVERLVALTLLGKPEFEHELIDSVDALSGLLLEKNGREIAFKLFDAIRHAYPSSRERLRKVIAKLIARERDYGSRLEESELAELDKFLITFQGTSLDARMRQQVGQGYWDRKNPPSFDDLAKEILVTDGALAKAWPWLTSGEADCAFYLGDALARQDKDKVLAESIADFPDTGPDLRLICGYLRVCHLERGDAWYDEWMQALLVKSPVPARLILELSWRCRTTPFVARTLTRLIEDEDVSSSMTGVLTVGRWGEDLPRDLLEELLEAMARKGHVATAIAILDNRIDQIPQELKNWEPLALRLVTNSELICGRDMTSYYWKLVAKKLVPAYAERIAQVILEEQSRTRDSVWFLDHSDAGEVLLDCATAEPAAVWRVLRAVLERPSDAYRMGFGFPRSILAQIPAETVMSWVAEVPEERAPMMARFVPEDYSSDDALACQLIGAYGDQDEVRGAFYSEYVSGSWFGRSSEHWTELANEMNQVATRTALHRLKTWALWMSTTLVEMAERDREREDEEDLLR